MAIYQELVDRFGFTQRYNSVKRFCRALRRREPAQFDRLEFLPGEECQVDYGEGALTRHPHSGRYRQPRLFVMTLRYSRRSYRRVVWKSSSEVWARLHEQAFRYFGGSVNYCVLDLREGVITPDIYEPQINRVIFAIDDDKTHSNSQQSPTSTAGFTAAVSPWPKTSLAFIAAHSSGPGSSNLLDLRITHALDNGHSVGLLARRSSGNSTDTEAMLTYTIPFNLPVGRKKGVATLHGRVYDADSASGKVPLKPMPPGRWIASVDEGGLPAGYEPEKKQIAVDAKPGEHVQIEFRLIPEVRSIRMQPPLRAIE